MCAERNTPWDGAATRQEEEGLGQQGKQNRTAAVQGLISSDGSHTHPGLLPSPAPRLAHHQAMVALT